MTATSTVQDVFERTEKKYLVSPEQYCALMEQIRSRLGYDRFGKSLISSLYYDTESDEIVTRSLEKPLYKEKIRVRAYGDTKADSRVFVEMKKKFKGIVYKRRFADEYSGKPLHRDGTLIMEIKCLGAYPLWLAHALTSTGLYPSSSTKIGRAYQLSHPTQAPRIRTDAMTWHAPEPKKNLMSRLTIMSLLNRSVEAR